jgi:ribulose-bisphosphate carboxylase large chain
MPVQRVEADYLIETWFDPADAAAAIAGEQSSGTFVPIPGETQALKERAAARVEHIEAVEIVDEPSLPGAKRPRPGTDSSIRRARVTLSWPLANFGPSLPTLLATVAGNLFELNQVSGLRLLDLRLPDAFAEAYPGPRFGIEGTRHLVGVEHRPLIGTIIKPSVGLSPKETATLVRKLAEADIDFIKDDELQVDGPHCPFEERVREVMGAIKECAQRHGRQMMYAFNLTGDLDEMCRRHDFVVAEGGLCVMVSLNSVGLAGIIGLARHSELPIHAHRNGWGYMSRHPLLGFSYVAWQKIWRLAGVDHMHVNGLQNKFSEEDASVIASARTCLTPLFPHKPCLVMPVFSSGQTVLQVPATFKALGSTNLIYAAGGGILAHPDGPAAGVRALREAWEATIKGQTLAEYAAARPSLKMALSVYGG